MVLFPKCMRRGGMAVVVVTVILQLRVCVRIINFYCYILSSTHLPWLTGFVALRAGFVKEPRRTRGANALWGYVIKRTRGTFC